MVLKSSENSSSTRRPSPGSHGTETQTAALTSLRAECFGTRCTVHRRCRCTLHLYISVQFPNQQCQPLRCKQSDESTHDRFGHLIFSVDCFLTFLFIQALNYRRKSVPLYTKPTKQNATIIIYKLLQ